MSKFLNRSEWASRVRGGGEAAPLRKQWPCSVKSAGTDPETGQERFEFVASTETVDREGDIIEVSGWELDAYRKNPVVLFGHDYGSLPVGKASKVGIKSNALMTTIEFVTAEQNPDGHRVYQLVAGGFLKSVSVGFRPLEYVYNETHNGYDFKRQELLEISIVPVPANAEALVAAHIDGDTARWLQRQLGEVVQTEDEAREIMTKVMSETMAEDGLDLGDMTEDEVRRIMHEAMAAEVTRTTGRLVDDYSPGDNSAEARLRSAIKAAMRQAVGGPEHEIRGRIRDLLRERIGS